MTCTRRDEAAAYTKRSLPPSPLAKGELPSSSRIRHSRYRPRPRVRGGALVAGPAVFAAASSSDLTLRVMLQAQRLTARGREGE